MTVVEGAMTVNEPTSGETTAPQPERRLQVVQRRGLGAKGKRMLHERG
jgi:hypothetical protein